MSFYCLIDEGKKFKELDGWLIDSLYKTYRQRVKLLNSNGIKHKEISKSDLISGNWYVPQPSLTGTGTFRPEVRLPSFLRGWRAARKFYYVFGLEEISKPKYLGYGYL